MVLGEVEFGKLWLKKQGNTLRDRNHPGAMCSETQYNNK